MDRILEKSISEAATMLQSKVELHSWMGNSQADRVSRECWATLVAVWFGGQTDQSQNKTGLSTTSDTTQQTVRDFFLI